VTRAKTEERLRLSLLRIVKGRPKVVGPSQKLSIKLVAKEAGVSPSLIHNRHPELAQQIRALISKQTPSRGAEKPHTLPTQTIKTLRSEIKLLRDDVQRIASINATLTLQARALKDRNDKLLEERAQLVEQLNRVPNGTVIQMKGKHSKEPSS
jgi:hypothetical protein